MRFRSNIIISVSILLLAAFSIGGATTAWFINAATIRNVFTAGTVRVSKPVITDQTNEQWIMEDGMKRNIVTWSMTNEGSKTAYFRIRPDLGFGCVIDLYNFCAWPTATPITDISEDYGYVPNSGDASVSKVNLLTGETVARYWTAPRYNENGNTVQPGAWRTSRLQVDADGNAWVINTGADIYLNDPANPGSGYRTYSSATGLVGSIVKVQSDTTGLTTNSDHAAPLPFGTDEAIQVFNVGGQGDIPRAIAVYHNDVWVGFYGGKYFQRYQYDAVAQTLFPVGDPVTGSSTAGTHNFVPYDAQIDCDGVLWFTSRASIPAIPNNMTGVYSFDTKLASPVVTRHATFNPYALFVDRDNIVWVTAYDSRLLKLDRRYQANFEVFTLSDSNQLRGLTMDYDGNLWLASSGNSRLIRYDPVANTSSFYPVGTRPVGVGRDSAGFIWAICRNDSATEGRLDRIDPTNPGGGVVTTLVGNRPYAYKDFTKANRPECEDYISWSLAPGCAASWYKGTDGWWYYGNPSGAIIVPPGGTVEVCFEISVAGGYDGYIDLSLIVEAVQTTHGAIDYTWIDNPWYIPPPFPSLAVSKVADLNIATIGDTVNYTILVTNDGNVGLTDISVIDGKLGISITGLSLSPGASSTFSGEYIVGESDLPGPLLNTATASATYDGKPVVSSDSAEVTLIAAASLSVTKDADRLTAVIGDSVNYTIVVTNNGVVTLTNINVVDTMLGINATITTLAPGESSTITGEYIVRDSDPDQLVNTATTDTTYDGQLVIASDSAEVSITPAVPSLSVSLAPNRTIAAVDETEITYTIVVTNSGNVTLTDISVIEVLTAFNGTISSLAPGESSTFTSAPYAVGREDWDIPHRLPNRPHLLENTVTVETDYNGDSVNDSATATVAMIISFNHESIAVGDRIRIPNIIGDYVEFQKIDYNRVLLRGTLGDAQQSGNPPSANNQGSNYYLSFVDVASNSGLLAREDEGEVKGAVSLDQLSIRQISVNWWTASAAQGSHYHYVGTNGTFASNNRNNSYGVRPAMTLLDHMYIISGYGTLLNPYILAAPGPGATP